jgi:predicted O-methyltransferase YrrM
MNPGKPWLCRGAVVYCEGVLTKSMTAIEFGSGRSTAWFAKHVGRLTSVEHDSGWHSQVAATLERERIANVDYRLVPLEHPENEPERATYEPLPAYVAVLNAFDDESLDLVVVDGHYRTTCIVNCLSKLRPNGLLLVDDVNLWPSESAIPVPANWPLVSRSSNGIKRTCVWRKPRKEC